MRYQALLSAFALALVARAAAAQNPGQSNAPSPAASADLVVAPECVLRAGDSTCVSRRAAIVRALASNPQLRMAGAVADQARASRVQAVALPDPTLGAELDNSKAPFGLGGYTGKVVGASITVPFFDKFRLNGRIGSAGIQQSQFDSVTVRHAIASQTSQTFDSLLAALRHRANLQQADSLARDFAAKTRARFDAGTVARLDVVNADVAVGQVGNDLIANERDIANARSSLNRLLGRPLGAPIAASDTLGVPSALPDLAALESAALANRPELASLESQRSGARAATQLSKEFWLPDLTVGISKDFLADPQPGYFTTGISMPIPLFYWNHSKGEIAVNRFRETELEAAYRDTQAAVGQDVRSAYAAAATALRQAIYIRDQLLPAARQAYRIASASYAL
ncbi:MAG: TolC family protein, partial [Gemmatimonadota bacterium]